MTTANATDYALNPAGMRHFFLRRLHSLTGIVFGGYLVVHLLVNATLAQAGDVYQMQVNKIHELPMLWAIEWALIYLPILFHTVYGVYIYFTGQPNPQAYPYTRNVFYTLQRTSAFFIVIFMLFHVLSLKYGLFGERLTFDPHAATSTVHRHLTVNGFITWILYPIGIVASCYHLANGFWAAAVTWGLTISAAAQRRFGYLCAGLFAFTLVCGLTALAAARVNEPKAPGEVLNVGHATVEQLR